MTSIRIATAQTPEFREDLDAAIDCALDFIAQAEAKGARLLAFPEGFLQGYLTEEEAAQRAALDLRSPTFHAVLARFAESKPVIVIGLIERDGQHLFNTAAVIHEGALVGRYRKAHLLRTEEFFKAGQDAPIFEIDGLRFGINICYDTNFPEAARQIADLGGSLIVCPTNNMLRCETAEKFRDVHNAVRGQRCRETGLWLISADVTGERDGRIALGPTAILNPHGEVVAQLPLGEPGLLVFDIPCSETQTQALSH